MFLTSKYRRLVRRLAREERGAALVAVIGIMLVGLLLSALILSSLTGGVGFTSATRAGVQSQAAAEAGIAAAHAGVVNGTCVGGVYTSNTVPTYTVNIFHRSSSNASWTAGCPTTASSQVKFVATGNAVAKGVSAQSANDISKVETIYNVPIQTVNIIGSGPAVYAYSSTGFGGSGTLVSIDGSEPDVIVKTGNVTCSGASTGGVDWVIDGGTFQVQGSCNITGNVWSTGRTSLSGSVQVGGNIVADGVTVASSRVLGSIWSTADLTSSGSSVLSQNATAETLDLKSVTLQGNAHIYGAAKLQQATIGGNLTSKSPNVSGGSVGSYTTIPAGPGASPYPTPAKPIVPNWFDFTYDMDDWTDFTEYVMPATTCDYARFQTAVAAIGTARGVIDARACTNAIEISSYQTLSINNDLAIFAKKWNFGGSGKIQGPASDDKDLWLITEDLTPNGIPTCIAGNTFSLAGTFDFDRLDTMIYNPCAVNLGSSTNIRGQIFAGSTSVAGGSTLGYVAVGIPGYNLDTGESNDTDDVNAPWVRKSTRNLSTSG